MFPEPCFIWVKEVSSSVFAGLGTYCSYLYHGLVFDRTAAWMWQHSATECSINTSIVMLECTVHSSMTYVLEYDPAGRHNVWPSLTLNVEDKVSCTVLWWWPASNSGVLTVDEGCVHLLARVGSSELSRTIMSGYSGSPRRWGTRHYGLPRF